MVITEDDFPGAGSEFSETEERWRPHKMKCLNPASIASIVLAVAALIVGLRAAGYWLDASKIPIDPGWNSGMPGDTRPIEPGDLEGTGRLSDWNNATMEAVWQSSNLNKKAAVWTAGAVVLAGVSSVVGALAGCF